MKEKLGRGSGSDEYHFILEDIEGTEDCKKASEICVVLSYQTISAYA
jgi:hypothetical protein